MYIISATIHGYMIRKSHLKSLSDMLEINKPDLAKIYAWIKAEGRHSDGSSTGGMHSQPSTGTRVLLRIFADAGLMPNEVVDLPGPAPTKPKTARKKQKKRDPASKARETTPPAQDLKFLGRLSVKDVGTIDINDPDTLVIAESYMRLLRKKMAGGAPDG